MKEQQQQSQKDKGGPRIPAWWGRLAAGERRLVLRLGGVLVLGLALMYGAGFFGAKEIPPSAAGMAGANQALIRAPEAAISASEEDLENKLLRILSAVEGAGKVQVALSFRESAAAEYAIDKEVSESSSIERDQQGESGHSASRTESLKLAEINDAPVLVKESMPLLAGAVIVAEGAGDPYVREKLAKAARILLGLPANRIEVLKSN